jgi:hypothetical protein
MPATLAQLVKVRSQLVEEVLAYLEALAKCAAELPSYYLAHCTDETGKMRFEDGTTFRLCRALTAQIGRSDLDGCQRGNYLRRSHR